MIISYIYHHYYSY